jgi:hypothetical protein
LNGFAWVAQNSELLRVDLASKAVARFPFEVTSDNKTMESFRPAPLRGRHAASAVAASPDGTKIAVAVKASSAVVLFDVSKSSFSLIRLRDAVDPTGVAFFPDGRLAVSTADYGTGEHVQVLVWDASFSEPQSVSVPDSSAVHSGLNGSLVVGDEYPSILNADLSVAIAPIDSGSQSESEGAATVLPDDSLATASPAGLTIAEPGNGATQTVAYPLEPCPTSFPAPLAVSDQTSTSQDAANTAPTECPLSPSAIAADAAGNIWMEFVGAGGPELAVVRAA